MDFHEFMQRVVRVDPRKGIDGEEWKEEKQPETKAKAGKQLRK